jgi:ribosome maturation factor RimP
MEGEESKTITGKVMGADESSVTLMDSGQEIVLSFDQIKSAKVKVSFNKP